MALTIETVARERLYKAFPDAPDIVDRLGAALPTLAGAEPVTSGLASWWEEGDNLLLARPGAALPHFDYDAQAPTRGALVALNGAASPAVLMIRGERPLVMIGEGVHLPNAWMHCAGGSTLIVGDHTASTNAAEMDARNGGLIYVGPQGLWATKVRLQTDDMHAVRDLEGRRLNRFGGTIVVERHVWLGHEALVLGGAHVGADVVVGARSLVKGRLDANCVYGGVPARRIRSGVTWTFEDLPSQPVYIDPAPSLAYQPRPSAPSLIAPSTATTPARASGSAGRGRRGPPSA